MKIQHNIVRWVGLSLIIAMAGCSSRTQPEFEKVVVPVKGRITFRGRQIPNAIVTFHAVDRSIIKSAVTGTEVTPFGVVSDNGTFSLTTGIANDGAPEGEYQVSVSWPSSLRESDNAWEQLPPQYQDPNLSGVRVRIAAGQSELPEITLN